MNKFKNYLTLTIGFVCLPIFISTNILVGQSNYYTGTNCPDITITTPISGNSHNEASNRIIGGTNNIIQSGSKVIYEAGNVRLKPGFRAVAGSEFRAKIGGCTNNRLSSSNTVETSISIQNYPNPFSENTTFEFNLTEESNVKLEVFDLTGKSVGVLIKRTRMPEGKHTLDFKAKNLTNGIFICKLSTDSKVTTHKLIIE